MLTSVATLVSTREAEAQNPFDAGDADVGPRSACTFVVTGGLPSSGDCTVSMFHSDATDARGQSDGFFLDADSPELRRVALWVSFRDSPKSGVVPPPPPPGSGYASPPQLFFGDAKVTARDGVEWVGIAGVQGTFQLTVTSVKKVRTEGGTGYAVHGELEIEMPVSNLNSANPRNPRRTLTLRATF